MDLSPKTRPGLSLLLQAITYADELNRDVWDFALEIAVLRQNGLTQNDLRWLVYESYLAHATEPAIAKRLRDAGTTTCRLLLSPSSCFILTPQGAEFVRKSFADPMECPAAPQLPPARGYVLPEEQSVPSWDKDRRELRFERSLVKQFKVPAPNQEIILAAFQEEGWPVRIDDPLPCHPAIDPKRRLHDAINSLNRNQRNPLLRFKGDGSGQAVGWERFQDSEYAAGTEPVANCRPQKFDRFPGRKDTTMSQSSAPVTRAADGEAD